MNGHIHRLHLELEILGVRGGALCVKNLDVDVKRPPRIEEKDLASDNLAGSVEVLAENSLDFLPVEGKFMYACVNEDAHSGFEAPLTSGQFVRGPARNVSAWAVYWGGLTCAAVLRRRV
jgi:hypothetical protein